MGVTAGIELLEIIVSIYLSELYYSVTAGIELLEIILSIYLSELYYMYLIYSVGVTAGIELLEIIVWPRVHPTSAPFKSLTNLKGN